MAFWEYSPFDVLMVGLACRAARCCACPFVRKALKTSPGWIFEYFGPGDLSRATPPWAVPYAGFCSSPAACTRRCVSLAVEILCIKTGLLDWSLGAHVYEANAFSKWSLGSIRYIYYGLSQVFRHRALAGWAPGFLHAPQAVGTYRRCALPPSTVLSASEARLCSSFNCISILLIFRRRFALPPLPTRRVFGKRNEVLCY